MDTKSSWLSFYLGFLVKKKDFPTKAALVTSIPAKPRSVSRVQLKICKNNKIYKYLAALKFIECLKNVFRKTLGSLGSERKNE